MNSSVLTKSKTKKVTGPGSILWLAILGTIVLAGIVAWGSLLVKGTKITHLTSINPWGIDIASFMLFMGMAAGSLMVAALPFILNSARYQPYAKIAVLVSLVASIGAGLAIFMHLGRPERAWQMIVNMRIGSPMIWDSFIMAALLIFSAFFLNRLIGFDQGKVDQVTIKKLAYGALIIGLLDGVAAFTYSLQAGHALWNSAIQPVAFIVSAMIAGIAAVIVLLTVLNSRKYLKLENELLPTLGKIGGGLMILQILLVGSEVITEGYSGMAHSSPLNGAAAPYFWTGIIFVTAAILIMLIPSFRRSPMLLSFGGILAIFGVFLNKLVLLVAAFSVPNLANPGVPTGKLAVAGSYVSNLPRGYYPSLVEIVLMLSVAALVILLLIFGFKRLPLLNEEMPK